MREDAVAVPLSGLSAPSGFCKSASDKTISGSESMILALAPCDVIIYRRWERSVEMCYGNIK